MRKEISRGSEEAQFWIDLMKFRQIWYAPRYDNGKLWEKDSDEWTKLIGSADRLIKKYENTDFKDVVQALILEYVACIEREYGQTKAD